VNGGVVISIEIILLISAVIIVISIFASKLSDRLGIPGFLLFLCIGMLAGSDGIGGIYFDNYWVAQLLGVIALVFIMFEGGLETDWQSTRSVFWKGVSLSTLGVLITAVLVGLFSVWVLKLSILHGMLLGAIVSSTDAAAVFSVFKSKNASLKGKLKPLLEFESGSNDPMAIFLTLGFIQLILNKTSSFWEFLLLFFSQMIIGAVLGYLSGKMMVILINRLRLKHEGLYPVFTLSVVILIYGITAFLKGSGFLAVYIAGIVLGNSDFIHKKSLTNFHDGLAWLMQLTMFIALGLLVFPSQLVPIIGVGLLVSIFLILIARPVSVFAVFAFSKMKLKEKALISWVGLRGAVPIVLATFPLLAGVPETDTIFNVVFFIVLTSALLQGTTIPVVAKWLGVSGTTLNQQRSLQEYIPSIKSANELTEIEIPKDSELVGKQIVEIGLPKKVLIVLITRKEEYIIPNGGVIIEAGDKLLLLAKKNIIDDIRATLTKTLKNAN
jgi:cell volume regulation protein A